MRNAVGGVQSVLVLGGGSDIALATADLLVDRGARTVVLAARRPALLDEAVERLRQRGADTVATATFDASQPHTHSAFVDEVFDTYGDIDLVLVAFGVLGDQDLFDDDVDAAVAAVQTNYVGGVASGLAVARRMRKQGHGTIVFLSSVAGERVRQANFVYGSSKAGLDGVAQGLGDRVAADGIEVMIVRPGFVHTKMTEGMDAAPLSTTPAAVAESIVAGHEKGSHTVWSTAPLRVRMLVHRQLPRAVFRRLPA
jgi:decaprenylphospho-beta-D-erythro-pentofuranosid-2-ulose 2-reductase